MHLHCCGPAITNYLLVRTSIITKSYLPLRILRKREEFKVAMYVAVVVHVGLAHTVHYIGNTMKQNSNHAPW